MLNGKSALMVFTFPIQATASINNTLAGIPVLGTQLSGLFGGIPIPIYLDENLTGIVIESESRAMDIRTDVNGSQNGEGADTKQGPLANEVSLNLIAPSDNVILSVLLTMFDTIYTRLVNNKYTLTYLRGPTTIFNGQLAGVTVTQGDNDNLLRVSVRISNAKAGPTLTNPDLTSKFTGPVTSNPVFTG